MTGEVFGEGLHGVLLVVLGYDTVHYVESCAVIHPLNEAAATSLYYSSGNSITHIDIAVRLKRFQKVNPIKIFSC